MIKDKWTYKDFEHRAKYKIGQKVYTIEYSSHESFIAPSSISIKENIITGLAKSTLRYSDVNKARIVYITPKGKFDKDYIFEEYSYATIKEAKIVLQKAIEETKEFYLKQYNSFRENLDSKYLNWVKYLENYKE